MPFNPRIPFASDEAYHDFLSLFTEFEYKLYGTINFTVVSKDDLEFDLYGGEAHYTERDFFGLSERLKELNTRWKTNVTYCLFPSSTHPAGILINVRSPGAPFARVA